MKKIKIYSEIMYILSIIIISFSVSCTVAAGLGVSVIVAPAYVVSLKTGLSFGTCEYLLQGVLFIILCITIRKFKLSYLSSFITSVLYGLCIDAWRKIIPVLTAPVESLTLPVRILFFVLGAVLTAIAVAMSFKAYIFPQVYDFFTSGMTGTYHFNLTKFLICYYAALLVVSVTLSLVFFHNVKALGIGTLIMATTEGIIIGFFSKLLDKTVETPPIFTKFATYFEL